MILLSKENRLNVEQKTQKTIQTITNRLLPIQSSLAENLNKIDQEYNKKFKNVLNENGKEKQLLEKFKEDLLKNKNSLLPEKSIIRHIIQQEIDKDYIQFIARHEAKEDYEKVKKNNIIDITLNDSLRDLNSFKTTVLYKQKPTAPGKGYLPSLILAIQCIRGNKRMP